MIYINTILLFYENLGINFKLKVECNTTFITAILASISVTAFFPDSVLNQSINQSIQGDRMYLRLLIFTKSSPIHNIHTSIHPHTHPSIHPSISFSSLPAVTSSIRKFTKYIK
jgi:hypothetical protein